MTILSGSIQHWVDTAANFTANNPILLSGQHGVESDGLLTTPKYKIGDGITHWNALPYSGSSGVAWGTITGSITAQTDLVSFIDNKFLLGNFLVVDTVNGSDATAVRGTLNYKYDTIGGAQAAAVAGDLIYILAGNYSTTISGKDGVYYYFCPGAIFNGTGKAFSISNKTIHILGEGEFTVNGNNVLSTTGTCTIYMHCKKITRSDTGGAMFINDSNSTVYFEASGECTSSQNGFYTGTTSTTYIKAPKITAKRAAFVVGTGSNCKCYFDVDDIQAVDTVSNVTTCFFVAGGRLSGRVGRAYLSNTLTTGGLITLANTAGTDVNIWGDLEVANNEYFCRSGGSNDYVNHYGRLIGNGNFTTGGANIHLGNPVSLPFKDTTPTGVANHTTFWADASGVPYYRIGTGSAVSLAPTGGTVTSVSGTANRITSTGGTTPIIDISASYAGQASIITLGTVTTGTWSATKINLAYGGTNADLSATGGTSQYLKQSSLGAAITVGTIPASDIASGAALTKVDDTNVTLTLGGTPASALLTAASLTLGWSGQLSLARGGTAANLTASNGGFIYSTASAMAIGPVGSSGQIIRSGGAGAYTWSTATYPSTATTAGAYMRADGTNWIMSTLVLPNSATANRIIHATATDTLGTNANLTYDSTTLNVGAGSVIASTTAGIFNGSVASGGLRVQITNTSASGFSGLLLGSSSTSLGSNNKYNASYVGSYTGSSINFANSYQINSNNASFGADPIVLAGTPVYAITGSTTTNAAWGLDTTGMRLDTLANIHNSRTSWLYIAAGTTGKSQIRLVPGVAPTSPVDGDIYYIDTNDKLMFYKNATESEFVITSSVNSVSPTSPNRTLTVLLGGTTYYIAAKTTND